jgi:hypothetical protein
VLLIYVVSRDLLCVLRVLCVSKRIRNAEDAKNAEKDLEDIACSEAVGKRVLVSLTDV